MLAALPEGIKDQFGDSLKTFIIHQYHVARAPENKIKELLEDIGISISEGKVHDILMEAADKFKPESENILKEGLKSEQIRVDDTGARHQKMNYHTTVVQNEFFAYFKTAPNKSRKNFLRLLQGEKIIYALHETSYAYMHEVKIKPDIISELLKYEGQQFKTLNEWESFLDSLKINKYTTGKNTLNYLEEAALIGGVFYSGVNLNAVLMSDNASQFKKIFLTHAICWIHMIRPVSKIVPKNEQEAIERDRILDMIWTFYEKLKTYQENPNTEQNQELIDEFNKIFEQTVESQELLEALYTFQKYKNGLLCVLKYPKTPLHNNSSESDIRPVVIKRKISGPTRSEKGLKARDIGLTIVKTCRKLKISSWKYIKDRISHKPTMTSLAEIIAKRRTSASENIRGGPP